MIQVRDAHVGFGARRVLTGLTFGIAPGERVAIVGLNGAGKTTLFRSLLGLTPYRGSITVAGTEVQQDVRAVRHALGYVPQRAPAYPGTLDEFLTFVAGVRRADPDQLRASVDRLGLSIPQFGSTPFGRMSGGMIQKTLLGTALATHPKVLLLDEPTANLDAPTRTELLSRIRKVSTDTTILLASHRMDDIEAIADRVMVLNRGVVAYDTTTSALESAFNSPVTLHLHVDPARYPEAQAAIDALPVTAALNGCLSVAVTESLVASTIHRIRNAGIDINRIQIERPTLAEHLQEFLGESS